MGFFGKLLKAGIDTAMLPVEVMKDVATMGGAVVDEDESFTVQRARRICKDLEEAYDALDEDKR